MASNLWRKLSLEKSPELRTFLQRVMFELPMDQVTVQLVTVADNGADWQENEASLPEGKLSRYIVNYSIWAKGISINLKKETILSSQGKKYRYSFNARELDSGSPEEAVVKAAFASINDLFHQSSLP